MGRNGYAQRDHQRADYGVVELAACLTGNGLRAIDIFFALDAFGRQFEGPGKYECEGEAQGKKQQQRLHNPVGRTEALECKFGNLRHQPGGNRIGNRHAEYVATLQFGK